MRLSTVSQSFQLKSNILIHVLRPSSSIKEFAHSRRYPKNARVPDSVIGIIVNEHLADHEYVEYLLQSFKAVLKEKGKGTARDNINVGTFESQTFPFPKLAVQNQIVSTLNSLAATSQRLEEIYKQKLAALEELKKSLLHHAFTGQLK